MKTFEQFCYSVIAAILLAFLIAGNAPPHFNIPGREIFIRAAYAQTCNPPSGWLEQKGNIPVNDILIYGPACGQLQDGGPSPPFVSLNPFKVTTLVAGDGTTTDRSGGSEIWDSRTLLNNMALTHVFSATDNIQDGASALGHNTYDCQTVLSTTGAGITVNHMFCNQSFDTFSGPGTLQVLGAYNWEPQVTGGTVTQSVFVNCTDPGVSGGGSIGSNVCIICQAMTAAGSNRCITSLAPVEFRQHIIMGTTTPTVFSGGGVGPVVAGTDTAGLVTMGTGTPTQIILTFVGSPAFISTPLCVVNWDNSAVTGTSWSVTASSITFNQDAFSSDRIHWWCVAQNGG